MTEIAVDYQQHEMVHNNNEHHERDSSDEGEEEDDEQSHRQQQDEDDNEEDDRCFSDIPSMIIVFQVLQTTSLPPDVLPSIYNEDLRMIEYRNEVEVEEEEEIIFRDMPSQPVKTNKKKKNTMTFTEKLKRRLLGLDGNTKHNRRNTRNNARNKTKNSRSLNDRKKTSSNKNGDRRRRRQTRSHDEYDFDFNDDSTLLTTTLTMSWK